MKLRSRTGLRGEEPWLIVLAVASSIELAWWSLCWEAGKAPAPSLGLSLALAFALCATAMILRRISGDAPRSSWPAILLATILIALGASLFLPLKYAIPRHVPFYLDPLLVIRERQLLGSDAWLIADRLGGWALPLVDLIYATWLPLQFLVLFSVVLLPPSAAKSRALIAYFLAWVLLGVLAASLLASVGPIFHDRLLGGQAFAGLSARLETSAPITWGEATMMWESFSRSRPGLVMGISAMPSLHVAVAVWIWLTARSLRSRLERFALAYAVLIGWGSVQLGWHYVSDGVAACLGMRILWWFSAVLVPVLSNATPAPGDAFDGATAPASPELLPAE